MDYGAHLKRGAQIVWNHKFLWILGFLAALGGSGAGSGSANFNFQGNPFGGVISGTTTGSTGPENIEGLPPFLENPELFFEQVQAWFFANQATLIGLGITLGVVLTVIRLILFFVRHGAEAAMIIGVNEVERGEKSSFRDAFQAGRAYLWRFVGMRLLLYLPVIALVLIAGIIFFSTTIGMIVAAFDATSGSAPFNPAAFGSSFFGLFCCFFILAIFMAIYNLIASILYPMAQRYMIYFGLDVFDSLRRAWSEFKLELGTYLLTAVILSLIMAVIGFVISLIVAPIVLVGFVPLGISFFNGIFPTTWQITLGVIAIIVSIVVSAILSAVAIAFRSTTFTLIFNELNPTEKSPEAI